MESQIDDSEIISEDEYIPINIPNTELLGDTVETNLIDILINNKKEYNIYTNIVICYIMKELLDDEQNDYSKKHDETFLII